MLWGAVESSLAQEAGYSTPYFIELYNGERVYARKLQYKSPLFKQNHFLLDDTLRFKPEEVKVFQNTEGYFARVNAGRRFSDFAQRERTGRISTFFVLRTDYNTYGPGVGMGMGGFGRYGYGGYGYPTQRKVYYYSKDNGPLEPLTYRNLRVALSDNPGSLESLQKYKSAQTLQTGMYVAGAGIIGVGLYQQFKGGQTSSFSPLLLVGLGVSLLPQLLKFTSKDRLSEAIELYNYERVD